MTPTIEPAIPPVKRKMPILISTFFLLQCAIAPESDEASTCGASVPTATVGGIPKKIKSGVIKKPPPTPNKPVRPPTIIPSNIISRTLTFISAIGR